MEKNKKLYFIVMGTALLVFGLLLFITNKEKKEEIPKETPKNNYVGVYKLKYNDNAPDYVKGNLEATLELLNNNTFVFNYNICSGMLEVKGFYSVGSDTILLTNLSSELKEQLQTNLDGKTSISFKIISEDELYLDLENDMACTISGNEYGSFIKK